MTQIIKVEYPSVPHRAPYFNTSVPHKDHTFSAPKIPQLNTTTPQFNLQLSPTKTPQVNTGVCGTEGCVELRGFWCGTEEHPINLFGNSFFVSFHLMCTIWGFHDSSGPQPSDIEFFRTFLVLSHIHILSFSAKIKCKVQLGSLKPWRQPAVRKMKAIFFENAVSKFNQVLKIYLIYCVEYLVLLFLIQEYGSTMCALRNVNTCHSGIGALNLTKIVIRKNETILFDSAIFNFYMYNINIRSQIFVIDSAAKLFPLLFKPFRF